MTFMWMFQRPPVGGGLRWPSSIKPPRAEARSTEDGVPPTAGQGARRENSARREALDASDAPGAEGGPDADAEKAAAFILAAGRARRVRVDEREPLDVEPEARFVLEADASDQEDEKTDAAVQAIMGASP